MEWAIVLRGAAARYTKLQEFRLSYKQRTSAPKPEMDKLRQFIQNDRKVILFIGRLIAVLS